MSFLWVNKLIFFPVCVRVCFVYSNRIPLCVPVFCGEFDDQHIDCSLQQRVFCYRGVVSHLCLHAGRNAVCHPSDRLRVRLSCFQCREENHLFVCHLIPELFYKAFTWWIQPCFCVKKSGAAALVCRQLTKPVLQGRCSKSVLYFQEINTEDFFFLLLQHLQMKNLSFCHLTVVYSDFYQTRGKKCWPKA